MTAMLFTVPKQRVLDANAIPAGGAKAYFYATGTTTDLTVYQDRARSIPHAQPVVADSAGWLPPIYPPDGTYKLQLKDSTGVDIFPPVDDQAGAITVSSGGSGGGDIAARILQVGSVVPWVTETIPIGWLECNGAPVSRVGNPDLYSVIGTKYGAGDGSTTFNLPDFRGRFLRGWDHAAGTDPNAATRTDRGDGTTGDHVGTKQADGYATHTHGYGTIGGITDNNNASHTHSIPATGDAGAAGTTGGGGIAQTSSVKTSGPESTVHQHTFVATSGATGASGSIAETRPKNINVTFIILASAVEASAGALGVNGVQYRFDTTTTLADPGDGYIRFNHGTYALVTALYISKTDANGANNGSYLATWDDSTSAVRGSVQINKIGALGTLNFFNIIGPSVDHTSYFEFPVAITSSNGALATNDTLSVLFSRTGDLGFGTGIVGATSSSSVGNGTDRVYTIAHGLNSYDVGVHLYRNSGARDDVAVDIARPDVNHVTLTFSSAQAAPTTDQYRAVMFANTTTQLIAPFIWKGEWATATAYLPKDAVYHLGSSYTVKTGASHTSGSTTEPGYGANWTTYWDIVALSGESRGTENLYNLMDEYYGVGAWTGRTGVGTGSDITPAINIGLTRLRAVYKRGTIEIPPISGGWMMKTGLASADLSGMHIRGHGTQHTIIAVAMGSGVVFRFQGDAGYTGGGLSNFTMLLDDGYPASTTYAIYLDPLSAQYAASELKIENVVCSVIGASYWYIGLQCDATVRDTAAGAYSQGIRDVIIRNLEIFSCRQLGAYIVNAVGMNIDQMGIFTGSGTGNDMYITGGGTAVTNSTKVNARAINCGGNFNFRNTSNFSMWTATGTLTVGADLTNGTLGYPVATTTVVGAVGANVVVN